MVPAERNRGAIKVISILEGAVLLYLRQNGKGTGPEITDFLVDSGIQTTANYLALALRAWESQRGWIQSIGLRRRFMGGAAGKLWELTRAGKKQAEAMEGLFAQLLGVSRRRRAS